MKTITVTLLFLFTGICQIAAQTADADSLQNLINKHTMPDTIRANLLNQLAWEIKGEVNNVCFPSGAIVKDDTLYIYYGAADTRIGCASVSLSELLAELQLNLK